MLYDVITNQELVPMDKSYTFVSLNENCATPVCITFGYSYGDIVIQNSTNSVWTRVPLTDNTIDNIREFLDMIEQEFHRDKDEDVNRRAKLFFQKKNTVAFGAD